MHFFPSTSILVQLLPWSPNRSLPCSWTSCFMGSTGALLQNCLWSLVALLQSNTCWSLRHLVSPQNRGTTTEGICAAFHFTCVEMLIKGMGWFPTLWSEGILGGHKKKSVCSSCGPPRDSWGLTSLALHLAKELLAAGWGLRRMDKYLGSGGVEWVSFAV